MTISISKFEKILFFITLVLAGAIFVLNVTNNDDKISNIFYVSFVLVLLLYILSCRREFLFIDVICIIVIVAAIISVTINFLLSSTPLSFEYFKKVLIFSTSILFLTYCSKSGRQRINVSLVALIFTALSLFCAVYYLLFRNSVYYNNGQNMLTLNLDNPNFAALFLSVFSMSQFAYAARKQAPIPIRILNLLLGLFLFYLVFKTQSRSSFTSLVLFAVIVVLFLIFRKTQSIRIPLWAAVIIAVFPLVFAFVYLGLIKNPFFNNIFDFMSGVGKGLDARESIWENALVYVKVSPLIGAYNEISNGSGLSQMHNTHLDVMASYGIPVTILVCCFLFYIIYNRGNRYSREQVLFLIAFMFSIVLGIGEAALFSGGQGLYIFIGCLLLLSRQDTDSYIKIGGIAI